MKNSFFIYRQSLHGKLFPRKVPPPSGKFLPYNSINAENSPRKILADGSR